MRVSDYVLVFNYKARSARGNACGLFFVEGSVRVGELRTSFWGERASDGLDLAWSLR